MSRCVHCDTPDPGDLALGLCGECWELLVEDELTHQKEPARSVLQDGPA